MEEYKRPFYPGEHQEQLSLYMSEFSPRLMLHNVPPNGSCGYSAIYDQLYPDLITTNPTLVRAWKLSLLHWAEKVMASLSDDELIAWTTSVHLKYLDVPDQTPREAWLQDLKRNDNPQEYMDSNMVIWASHYLQLPIQIFGNLNRADPPLCITYPKRTFSIPGYTLPLRFLAPSPPHHLLLFLDSTLPHYQSIHSLAFSITLDHLQQIYAHSPFGMARHVLSSLTHAPSALWQKFENSLAEPQADYITSIWPTCARDSGRVTALCKRWQQDPTLFPTTALHPLTLSHVQHLLTPHTRIDDAILTVRLETMVKTMRRVVSEGVGSIDPTSRPHHETLLFTDTLFMQMLVDLPRGLVTRATKALQNRLSHQGQSAIDTTSLCPAPSLQGEGAEEPPLPLKTKEGVADWLSPQCTSDEALMLWKVERMMDRFLDQAPLGTIQLTGCFAPASPFHYEQWLVPCFVKRPVEHFLLLQTSPLDSTTLIYDSLLPDARTDEYKGMHSKLTGYLHRWMHYMWARQLMKLPATLREAYTATLVHGSRFLQSPAIPWKTWALHSRLPFQSADSNDCGIFLLSYVETLLEYRHQNHVLFLWDQSHMNIYRIYLLAEILHAKKVNY